MTTLLANKRELARLNAAKVGDTVEFFYRGFGDNRNQDRTAKVLEVQRDGILAEDLVYGGVKRFLNNEAAEPYVLDNEDGSRVRFDEAISTLTARGTLTPAIAEVLTGEQLATVYGKHVTGTPVVFDENTGELVVAKPQKTLRVASYNGSTHFDVTRNDGDSIDVYINGDTITFEDAYGNRSKVTPLQLGEKLVEFCS